MSDLLELRQIKEDHKAYLMSLPNVVGVGIGYKVIGGVRTTESCIVVMVRRKLASHALSVSGFIPKTVGGVITDVVQVGEVRALQARTDRWRPAPGGVSIGHHAVTAGTLGAIVRDRKTQAWMVLSNNHVLANSNDAQVGDVILQPGAADGGTPVEDTIGHLARFHPIQFAQLPSDCEYAQTAEMLVNTVAILLGSKHRLRARQEIPTATNLVDCAVALPGEADWITDEILEVGVVEGVREAELGLPVVKSGRTTALNHGEVVALDTSISVSYGGLNIATFEGQIATSAMAEGGDSGSLLVSEADNRAVGLLFAGSDSMTVHNPIQAVLDALDVEI